MQKFAVCEPQKFLPAKVSDNRVHKLKKKRQKFRHIQISFPIDLKKSCVKRSICFLQKMSDQTNL